MKGEHKYVPIRSRKGAIVGFVITGYLCAQLIRALVSHAPLQAEPLANLFWIFPALPTWAHAGISVAFWAYIGWTIFAFCRAAQGKERILFAGWLADFILIPAKYGLPPAFAPAIQFMQAIAMGIATIAAFLMIWQTYPAFEVVPTRTSKVQWIWVGLIFIACAFMVIYYMPRGR